MLGIEIHIPEMDFEGQKLAEILQYVILGGFGIVGFIWGYLCESFQQTFYVVAVGALVASMLVFPPWPIYRKNPLPFQPIQKASKAAPEPAAASSKSKKKKN